MVVGEKILFDEAYEEVGEGRSDLVPFATPLNDQLSVRTSSARQIKASELGFLIGRF